jgi:methyl-accepting chemotaxis protein
MMTHSRKKEDTYRHQYLINKSFQYRIIWRFVSMVIISILFSQFLIIGYLKLSAFISPTSQNMIYFSDTLRATLSLTHILEVIWFPLLISAFISSILVCIFSIFYSHRLSGPIFNLKRMMHHAQEGKLNITMRIRGTDEFQDLTESFNTMTTGLAQKLMNLRDEIIPHSGSNQKKILDSFNKYFTLDEEG